MAMTNQELQLEHAAQVDLSEYVHGFSPEESARLEAQADCLRELLHAELKCPPGGQILEVGCGVGVQTVTLARRHPECTIVAMDANPLALEQARSRVQMHRLRNVRFELGDALCLPFAAGTFDHAAVFFLLEHLPEPAAALREVRRTLAAGGRITVVEGDHGATCFFPWSPEGAYVIDCAARIQRAMGGDACIGRRLGPLLQQAGYARVDVTPCPVYADATRPLEAELFGRRTFVSMLAGLRDRAARLGGLDERAWQRGLADLERATEPGGSLTYTFFRALAEA